ncbi:MAG: hypothetical protein ACLU0T_06430, partial [Bacteroidales bacterium]
WNDSSVFCADELSQAVRQSRFDKSSNGNVTRVALDELHARIENDSNLVVTVSATPRTFIKEFAEDTRLVGMYLLPEGYKTRVEEWYNELDELLEKVDSEKRGLIYIGRIGQMKHAVDKLESRGIHAVGIFSENHKEYKMSAEQRSVADSLVQSEKIPDDVQVLIINSAYETGLNISPEKSHLDYIAIHNSNEDTQAQVRGRYRGDIDLVYLKTKTDQKIYEIPPEIIEPYLGKRLYTEQKRELLAELHFKNERGRQLSWKGLVHELECRGYVVSTGKSGSNRYYMITLPCA